MLSNRTPEEFSKVLESIDLQQSKQPPVEKWQPQNEVSVDISIDSDGQWFYQGRPMKRKSAVRLFSSIIRQEGDLYFLVTPVEKARLKVADVPFVIVSWEQYLNERQQPMVVVHSSVGHQTVLSAQHPLVLVRKTSNQQEQHIPYVVLQRGLRAKVRRSVFYQLIEQGQPVEDGGLSKIVLRSGDESFELGRFDTEE